MLPLMRILGALQTHTTDTFLFISHTTKVLLFKFSCNIFIGVTIIKEMPGSVASGTHCTSTSTVLTNKRTQLSLDLQYFQNVKLLNVGELAGSRSGSASIFVV